MGIYSIPPCLTVSALHWRASVLLISSDPHGSNFRDVIEAHNKLRKLAKAMDIPRGDSKPSYTALSLVLS